MAVTTYHPPMVHTSGSGSPNSAMPVFPRLPAPISRNASTSSSCSTTTTSSTSSLVAAPIRPPPPETRTAATNDAQFSSRPGSSGRGTGLGDAGGGYASSGSAGYSAMSSSGYHSPVPGGSYVSAPRGMYGGSSSARGGMRNGPRSRQGTLALPSIITTPDLIPSRASSVPLPIDPTSERRHLSPTTPRASRFAESEDEAQPRSQQSGGSSSGNRRSSRVSSQGTAEPTSPLAASSNRSSAGSAMTERKGRTLSVGADHGRSASADRDRRQSMASNRSAATGRVRESPKDYIFGEELGRGSYSTVSRASGSPG